MRKFLVTVNGDSYEVMVEEIGGVAKVAPQPVAAPVAAAPAAPAAPAPAPAAGGTKVVSPMPGTILGVKVQVGQVVKAGDVLLILEAMKMENEIPAPVGGKVAQIAVSKGSAVNTGDLMIVLA